MSVHVYFPAQLCGFAPACPQCWVRTHLVVWSAVTIFFWLFQLLQSCLLLKNTTIELLKFGLCYVPTVTLEAVFWVLDPHSHTHTPPLDWWRGVPYWLHIGALLNNQHTMAGSSPEICHQVISPSACVLLVFYPTNTLVEWKYLNCGCSCELLNWLWRKGSHRHVK